MNTADNRCIVVGSGPAGVSCAVALLQKGANVTLLDAGVALESDRAAQVARLRSTKPEEWHAKDLTFMQQETAASTAGIPLKRAFGSDYPYRDPGIGWQIESHGVETRPSFSLGGLSSVWGAAILPYRSPDIPDWPIRDSELAPHYRAVHEFVPLAGCRDSLQDLFPLHSDHPLPLRPSEQARRFLQKLGVAGEALKQSGIYYGASRLAVWANTDGATSGCCYCGQCMYGCPYEAIYCSAQTLGRLRQHPNFSYQNNTAVNRVIEDLGAGVTIEGHNLGTHEPLRFEASRVFLACGVLPTTKIVLESLGSFEENVELLDCYYFLLPLLCFQRSRGASKEQLHTLSQVFLEILDSEICEKTIHLQLYTYNELYSVALRNMFGKSYGFLRNPAALLLERLMLIQGYLPSDYSPSVRVKLRRGSGSIGSVLQLAPIPCARTTLAIKRIMRKLRKHSRHLGAIPLSIMFRPGKPGRGFHSGGTFPMKTAPGRFESDRWGRPSGFKRVHAVDSSIFPSIPATTITLTVMANAHRIGSGLGDY